MKTFYLLILTLCTGLGFSFIVSAKEEAAGKAIFYKLEGKYGTCNTCHPGGGSAGRWNFETKKIDPDEGRKIPELKCIGKKKTPEQIERAIKLMKKMFEFKLTDEQISELADYVKTL